MRVVLLVALLLTASAAIAEPVAQLERSGVRIVLYDEACALTAVGNLPLRAEWTSKGKVYAGCWKLDKAFSLIVMYFDDRTAITIPMRYFSAAQGA